ncbi:MAG: hypothetical protein JKY65_00965 [Planctomycetes bacterium]|nr:hypothetical protein [Planctomycetota bacterium]
MSQDDPVLVDPPDQAAQQRGEAEYAHLPATALLKGKGSRDREFFIERKSQSGDVIHRGLLKVRKYTTESIRSIVKSGATLVRRQAEGAFDFRHALCTVCKIVVNGGDQENVSNLIKHLKTLHQQEYRTFLETCKKWQPRANEELNPRRWSANNHDVCTMLALRWMAAKGKPLGAFGDPDFRAFFSFVSAGHELPCATTLSDRSVKLADAVRDELGELVRQARGYSISSDGWTGINGVGYFVVCVNFVDENFEYRSGILDLHALPDQHSAIVLKGCLLRTFNAYGLDPKRLVSLVGDTAKTQQKAMKTAGETWVGADAKRATPCIAHVLQLCIRQPLGLNSQSGKASVGLEPLSKLLDEASSIVAFMGRSVLAQTGMRATCEMLQKEAKQEGLQSEATQFAAYGLISALPTRWNASYSSLKRLLRLSKPAADVLADLVQRQKGAAKRKAAEMLDLLTGIMQPGRKDILIDFIDVLGS